MRTARTRLAFSVLIVLAMVSSGLGVGFISAMRASTPAVSGPSGNVGTRSEGSPAVVTAMGQNLNGVQENNLPTNTLSTDTQKPTMESIPKTDASLLKGAQAPANTIKQTVVSNQGTKSPGFSAGGPYGGPDCFEGSCVVHFEIVTDDPTLIFFRWDFNNDGVWDTPWMTDKMIDMTFYHPYYGFVVAEGWDGVSTSTLILTGDNLGETTNLYWYIYPVNVGWKFKAKADFDATELGLWDYYYTFPVLSLRIYTASGGFLGGCTPPVQNTYAWNWCTLATPIHLTLGQEYVISEHKDYDYYPYFLGVNNPNVPWTMVNYVDYVYAWGQPQRMPDQPGGTGTQVVPMLDFRWRQVLIIPLTQSDKNILDIRNVAPQPFGVMTDPASGYEGSSLKFSAFFTDPGTDSDWWYRWNFGDGTGWTGWQKVKKFNGGANVLMYHSLTGDIGAFKQKIIDLCGYFCLTVDDYDFGPLGTNTLMTLDQLMAYDVIFVDTNWGPIPDPNGIGNQLADYMDQKGSSGSGGIVMGMGAEISGSPWDIRGRFFSDEYNPVAKANYGFGSTPMGTIYVPGHPILDGVNSISAYMRLFSRTTTTDTTRIADFTDGYILAAEKVDPIVANNARSVALSFSTWYQCTGDCALIATNAIKYASRQPAPTPMTMPIQLPWTGHTWADDDPVTTSPEDQFDVQVQVKDDSHLKTFGFTDPVWSENFQNDCSYSMFPPGWVNEPWYGWSCEYGGNVGRNAAVIWYYYNDGAESLLTSPSFDLSGYAGAKVSWYQFWWADYSGAYQDGYVEASVDGGLTFPYLLAEFHHNDPGSLLASYSVEEAGLAGNSNVQLRFRFDSGFDWEWEVTNIVVYGMTGYLSWGLGNATGVATIMNVPPTIAGGPSSGLRNEMDSFTISGMEISDPAIMAPTEWTAYKMSFDDGSPAQWIYKGTLAPPKNNILIINSLCGGGNGCSDYTSLANMLSAMDLTGSVTGFDFFGQLAAPSLSYMMGFDVIIFASNYAYLSYPPFDAARLAIGNNLAAYMDSGRGGVVTFMFTFDDSPYYGDLFSFLGRYKDQQYGPFIPDIYSFTPAVLGTVRLPDHPVMKGVKSVQGLYTGSGDLQTTPGGIRLADNNAGGAAVGVKELANGARTCALQFYGGGISGADGSKLVRNCIGWAIGGIPTPEIPPVTHAWGDNGLYTVDVTLIDDDMGWTWDFVNNEPVADPMYPQTFSHHYIPVEVNNVDPTILGSNDPGNGGPGAYTTADLCVRLSGNKGNDVVLTLMGSDGSFYSVRTSRVSGNPAIGCLPTVTIDMTPSTKYTLTIAYDPTGDDGANPEWIFSSTWPDGKIKELRYTFNSNDGPSVVTIDNKQFKQLAIGSPITFHATAYDPGSDDLAFIWIWGEALPYDIHDYKHPGIFYQAFQADQLNNLPFSDPTFVKSTNSIRSPEVDPTRAHDTVKHTFGATTGFLYVTLTVVDDDNGNAYPSPYLWPGMDMEIIQIDV